MSIFLNKEVKEYTQNYWFGLVLPILIGWSCSLVSFSAVVARNSPEGESTLIDYFFFTCFVMGHLVIWPLLSWWLIQRANETDNIARLKGASMSIKLYLVWLLLFIVPSLISLFSESG